MSQWFCTDNEPSNKSDSGGNGYTYIYDEAAPISGNITGIECYMDTGQTVKFAVFSKSASNFTGLRSVSIVCSNGLNQFSSPGDFSQMEIAAGNYFGFYCSAGSLDRDDAAGDDMWYPDDGTGDFTATVKAYSSAGPYEFQLRAYITEAASGTVVPIILGQMRRRRL